ncbi:MAG: class I SAM-dependent rRNA methyltransferase [Bacteroidales bacterium]|nr:class I SAM-dependent rRNA methyltransferase [Bacteroidales bacterium]
MELVKITLKSGKDQSVRRYHPWIFSGAIKKIYGKPQEGDMVEVFDNHDNFLATGHYQSGSIMIRILSFVREETGISLIEKRIDDALRYRSHLPFVKSGDTNLMRLIHGEGDNLPGLIIDYYNGVAVIQAHSMGFHRIRNEIAGILMVNRWFPVTAVYDKSEKSLPGSSGVTAVEGFIAGSAEENVVTEYGNRFRVDWVNGQKTGFFIDQRENRRLLGEYSEGKRVLNLFGYTGGFSVYALRNALSVDTVDVSARAMEMADLNVELNFPGSDRHRSLVADAFEYLGNAPERYDLMILDPPAFAKHGNVLHNALQGYKRLNMKAIEKIEPGGVIFTFSCSQVVSRENFRKSVFAAAANTGRKVRIIHQLTQPGDHPVNIYHPESEYLKGLVLSVD